MFGLKEKMSDSKILSDKNVTAPNSKETTNELTSASQLTISDEEVKKLDAIYSSWGDTVHYSQDPKVFRGCEGSYMFDSEELLFVSSVLSKSIKEHNVNKKRRVKKLD